MILSIRILVFKKNERTATKRPVVYLDEALVNQNYTRGYIWKNSNNTEGLCVPIGKCCRHIVCHVRSGLFGFV